MTNDTKPPMIATEYELSALGIGYTPFLDYGPTHVALTDRHGSVVEQVIPVYEDSSRPPRYCIPVPANFCEAWVECTSLVWSEDTEIQ
jgi:hypothetical protein